MIALGVVLVVLGLLFGVPLLWIVGALLAVAGAALYARPGHRGYF